MLDHNDVRTTMIYAQTIISDLRPLQSAIEQVHYKGIPCILR
jgi:hypothetical protein